MTITEEQFIALGGAAVAVLVGLAAWWLWQRRRRAARREELEAQPLSLRERVVLEKALPWYRDLPEVFRARLEGKMRVFLAEKHFEPCGDLDEVTEEMRLVIASLACLLIVNRPGDHYAGLHSVLIYPSAFRVPVHDDVADGVEVVDQEARIGESWGRGTVVLAWDSVLRGGVNYEDGLNVVLHEFAHQLDQANGPSDGAPILERGSDYRAWSRVFRAAYGDHVEKSESGKRTVLDAYGAENPAEFFAVATETFFEKPRQLLETYPELHAELVKFYGLDPGGWR